MTEAERLAMAVDMMTKGCRMIGQLAADRTLAQMRENAGFVPEVRDAARAGVIAGFVDTIDASWLGKP